MEETHQTKDMNVYQHGKQVWFYMNKILNGDHQDMRIPSWFSENKDFILGSLPDRDMLQTYAIWHDIGKTETLVVGEDGRRHFPGHAEASRRLWLELGGEE